MPSSENVLISCKKSCNTFTIHLQLFIVEIKGPSRLIQKCIDHWETKSNENHPKNVLILIKKKQLTKTERKRWPFLDPKKVVCLTRSVHLFVYINKYNNDNNITSLVHIHSYLPWAP